MSNDTLSVIAVAFITGVTGYTLPKLIEVIFNRQNLHASTEKTQQEIEAARWTQAQEDLNSERLENKRLRAILRRHDIDPQESGPLDDKKVKA